LVPALRLSLLRRLRESLDLAESLAEGRRPTSPHFPGLITVLVRLRAPRAAPGRLSSGCTDPRTTRSRRALLAAAGGPRDDDSEARTTAPRTGSGLGVRPRRRPPPRCPPWSGRSGTHMPRSGAPPPGIGSRRSCETCEGRS